MQKEFIQANDLVRDSFRLARQIYDTGYRPDVLLVLWRGGTPVGIVIHEFFLHSGVQTYHTAIKAESYTGIGKRIEPRIEKLDSVFDALTPDSRVLVVDDIFDSGCTVSRVCELLRQKTCHIKVATLFFKDGASRVAMKPDFYLRKTDRWIVFPHELMDLTFDEIRRKDPVVAEIVG